MSSRLYVTFKTDEQRDRLVEEYTYLGYYVKVVDGRVLVSSIHPKKAKKEDDKKAPKSEDRPRRRIDKRD